MGDFKQLFTEPDTGLDTGLTGKMDGLDIDTEVT